LSPKQNATSHNGVCKSEKKRSAAYFDGEEKSKKSAADSGTSESLTGIVYSLFQAQFRSVVKCPVCHKESSSIEPFLFVPLPLPDFSFPISAMVVRSHPHYSVLEISVNICRFGCVKDLRMAYAEAADIPVNQACVTLSF